MNLLDKPREILLRLIKEHNTDLKTVSEQVGKNAAYLQQYITRGSPKTLHEDTRDRLSEIFNVHPDIFRYGEEGESLPIPSKPSNVGSLNLQIPELDISPQAGSGAIISDIVEHQQPVDHWSFPKSLVGAFVTDPSKLAIIRVAGDSMEPDYVAGDRILVDTGHVIPSPAGVYVLWDGLGVVLKRVEIVMGSDPKRIRIMSINPAYPAYELLLDEVKINGRVVGKWNWK
ncbi:S24 family peptidase [Swingsia samuiensis]|uniref:Helix-turn-helix transcriptional regulator n=1 Tax=Swingsia samuiensis TaxID=1293412 RepID=A0A4Y6ULB7_9PROT|nr:S24 family peptidase [Swingsia samuiensis]QDH17438.1 helix-turn-helix transcriptional regulator [Swingsia samuiensis]